MKLKLQSLVTRCEEPIPWKRPWGLEKLRAKAEEADKGSSNQSFGFPTSQVWMWELGHKQSWVPKNWCFWTIVLEKTLGSPLDCKGIKLVNPKGNRSWIFIERTDAEAEVPILWSPDGKNWLIGKDPDVGKDCWRRRGWQRVRWLYGLIDAMDLSLSRRQELVMDS